MSGSLVPGSYPFPVNNGLVPPERPRIVPYTVYWSRAAPSPGVYSASINLLSAYQSGQFTTVQSVYVDNSSVPFPVSLASSETGQVIRVPAFSQGMFPVFSSSAPSFRLTGLVPLDINYSQYFLTNCTTRLFFLNTEQGSFGPAQVPGVGAEAFFTVAVGASPYTVVNAPPSGYLYSLSGFVLTLSAPVAPAAASIVTVGIVEEGSATYSLFSDAFYQTATAGAVQYSRQFVFASPVLQRNPLNGIGLAFSSIPPAGWDAYGTLALSLVPYG